MERLLMDCRRPKGTYEWKLSGVSASPLEVAGELSPIRSDSIRIYPHAMCILVPMVDATIGSMRPSGTISDFIIHAELYIQSHDLCYKNQSSSSISYGILFESIANISFQAMFHSNEKMTNCCSPLFVCSGRIIVTQDYASSGASSLEYISFVWIVVVQVQYNSSVKVDTRQIHFTQKIRLLDPSKWKEKRNLSCSTS